MSQIIFALLLGLAVFVQATFLQSQDYVQVVPDATLILLLVWSSMRGLWDGLFWAFGVGLVLDVISLDKFGTNALALLPVVILGSLSNRQFFHSNLLVPIFTVMVATVLHGIILLLLRSGENSALAFSAVARVILMQALLNVILLPFVYGLLSLLNRNQRYRYA